MTQCTTKVERNQRKDNGAGNGQWSGQPGHSEQKVGEESNQGESHENQDVQANEWCTGDGRNQGCKSVLGDIDAGEVVQVHAEREAVLV